MAPGHGAKGLLWYTAAGPPSVFSQTNWPEMAYEARIWRVLGQDLASGTPWDGGATTTASNIDLGTIVSPDAAILTVANLDYDNLTDPTTFNERSGIVIDWQLPPWLEDTTLTLAEVSPSGVRPLGPFVTPPRSQHS